MISCSSLCVLVHGVLFSLSCFALFVVVSMTMMAFVRSVLFMWLYVRCRVNVLCLVMLYFCCRLLLFLLMMSSACWISVVLVFLLLLSW